jgi:hypothetical protein
MGFSAPPNVETGLIYGVQRPEAPRASSREVEVNLPLSRRAAADRATMVARVPHDFLALHFSYSIRGYKMGVQ